MGKYLIHTYGCQMNVHESEKLAGILEERGYTLADSNENADVIVFNTCAIRESAEKKIFGHIGDLKQLKKKNPNMIICVCGCMSQQNGYDEMLLQKYPYIDIVFGTHNIAKFGELLDKRNKIKKHFSSIVTTENIIDRDSMPKTRTSGINAWVNINYGCNNFCTYCIVPYVRGREISRPLDAIVCEVKQLLDAGYKQITLLGQNVNSYGNDFDDDTCFAKLLNILDKLDYEYRLTFMTSHPKDLSSEVINVISKSKHIMHYIHLPFQSGSNRILGLMNRKYTREKYLATVKEIKEKIPNVQLSSDIIVGFPTETEEDFLDTMDLVKQVGFEQLFMFIYSKRKGTVAEKMDGQVDIKVKKERLRRLIELQQGIGEKISETFVGKDLVVLIDSISPKYAGSVVGSTNFNKAVTVKGDASLIGKFVKVRITKAKLTSLFGEVIKE